MSTCCVPCAAGRRQSPASLSVHVLFGCRCAWATTPWPASVCWFFAAGLDRGETKIDPLGLRNPSWLAQTVEPGSSLDQSISAQGRILTREGAELAICSYSCGLAEARPEMGLLTSRDPNGGVASRAQFETIDYTWLLGCRSNRW